MDKSDHKLTIHRSQEKHWKNSLHRMELQEHRGEHGIENQRERRSHLANNYGPEGLW